MHIFRYFLNFFFLLFPPVGYFGLRSIIWSYAGVKLQNNVSFCGHGFIYGRGSVFINTNTWISPGLVLRTHVDAPISIGSNCDIGPNVEIITGTHLIGPSYRRAGPGIANPVEISNGCWIGARVLILGGVTIGAGSIVAAGAVVVKDVPDNVLVAGIPARIIKQLI